MNAPYENLANAIIIQAAKDYRKTLRKQKTTPTPSKRADKMYAQLLLKKAEIESFFYSEWYLTLTSVDPRVIIRHIEKEVG